MREAADGRRATGGRRAMDGGSPAGATLCGRTKRGPVRAQKKRGPAAPSLASRAFASGARALRAQPPVRHLDVRHREAEALGVGEVGERVARRVDVTDRAAVGTDQVVVRPVRVRVVPLGAPVRGDFQDLAESDQLTERVVDGRPGDLRQLRDGPRMDLVGCQMDVLAVEDLGHHASLRGHPPSASTQSFQKVAHGYQPNSKGDQDGNRCEIGILFDLD
ncbi:Putative hydrogen peroxide sensitive repressor [Streptomyces misionensis JCM 4497]